MLTMILCASLLGVAVWLCKENPDPHRQSPQPTILDMVGAVILGLIVGAVQAIYVTHQLPTHQELLNTQTIQCSKIGDHKTCLYTTADTIQYYLVQKKFGAGIISAERSIRDTTIIEENRINAVMRIYTRVHNEGWQTWFAFPLNNEISFEFLVPKGSVKKIP